MQATESITLTEATLIKVMGIGCGGSNALAYLFRHTPGGIGYISANTNTQRLVETPVPVKIQLGGKPLGPNPEMLFARQCTEQSEPEIREALEGTMLLFMVAGIGGPTGRGAAPVIARIAQSMGIITVGLLTLPNPAQEPAKYEAAKIGLSELQPYCDSAMVIDTGQIEELYGAISEDDKFAIINRIFQNATEATADIIAYTGIINIDFNDIASILRKSNSLFISSAAAEGENRAIEAAKAALNTTLLRKQGIKGANRILLNIQTGIYDINLDEYSEITEMVSDAAGPFARVKCGYSMNPEMGEKIKVSVIAADFRD